VSNISFYKILELPSKKYDQSKILEHIGKNNFMIVYDFEKCISFLALLNCNSEVIIDRIIEDISGINFIKLEYNSFNVQNCCVFSVYRMIEKYSTSLFSDIFSIGLKEGFLAILFINTHLDEIGTTKSNLEHILSSKITRSTESQFKGTINNRLNSTVQKDSYYQSEENIILANVIESLNNAVLTNGLAYKIFLITKSNSSALNNYIDTHFLLLSQYNFNKNNIDDIVDFLSKRPSLPFGINYAKEFMNFYGSHNINHTLTTFLPLEENGIRVGKLVKNGTSETESNINIDPSTINLGFIITGLPGSGKTMETMSIIDSLLKINGKKPIVFVITPTTEWEIFASDHRMNFIKLYQDNVPINFFRCPKSIEVEKFYGNLAMILSSAANAGPYRNPMEKCMLNAFKKIYKNNNEPDPVSVYNEIEESIINYHGKKTPSGVKYTKHGENIRSALENLRSIISRPQYCVKNGIKIEDFNSEGFVFDVSGTSTNIRAQLYALILNQIYALADNFNTDGDNELRIVICIEEAQTIFKDETSPAVQDIKQRIQDFRKQGIGLVLLTHNVNDIDIGIRRLCQLKLYLKQSPDVATVASKDLIFSYSDSDDVIIKLKTLQSRVGAFNYISKRGGEKRQQDTIFIKTDTYNFNECQVFYNPINSFVEEHSLTPVELINCSILLNIRDQKISLDSLRISFLGEEIDKIKINDIESYGIYLFKDKEYKIYLLNNKGKFLKELSIKATEKINIDF
jgi:hypothetical protein